jgi:alkanesulfonate monooxygenase SsuD/methylene tetrahydromethanopterin reductase-like flavin-dependent oxidoreductase (luciferase family)
MILCYRSTHDYLCATQRVEVMESDMFYGIELWAAANGSPSVLAELARLAEESGWDGFFLEDYITHWYGRDTYDPWISLAAIALNTHRIRLGTIVTALPRRRPWKLAREILTLDHLSNGRMVLGVGLGGGEDMEQFGEVADVKQRAQMADEAIDILRGLWSGEHFSYAGKHYQVTNARFLPKPVQTPDIPIWVGGGWPGPAIKRAVRCDGFAPIIYKNTKNGVQEEQGPDDVRAMKAYVESQRGPAASFDLVFGGRMRRQDWDEEREHLRAMANAGATWWVEFVEPPDLDLQTVQDYIRQGPLRVD